MSKTLDFEMFTNAGNKKCTEVYEKLVTPQKKIKL
jgi:hypothetical protein